MVAATASAPDRLPGHIGPRMSDVVSGCQATAGDGFAQRFVVAIVLVGICSGVTHQHPIGFVALTEVGRNRNAITGAVREPFDDNA